LVGFNEHYFKVGENIYLYKQLVLKKIIHIISDLRRGGRERQLATIAANTDFEKYPTRIICFNSSKESYIDEYSLNDHIIKLKSKNFLLRLQELNSLFKENKPDIVFTWGNSESVYTLILKPLHKFTFLNGSIRHGIRSRQFSHYFRTVVLHLSQNVVANSYAGLKANNLKRGFVLYNGIDEKFSVPLTDRITKRRELVNISSEKSVFISVANLVPYKDYVTVFTALKKLKSGGGDFHYLILGDGPLRKNIENYIIDLGLEKNINIVGIKKNVHEYLKISDIFIHSSKGEGCSNAILEAMAAGLPIVATETGGTPEIVSRENGFLFEYGNSKELIDILAYCVQNPHECANMGRNSVKKVQEKFTTEKMIQNYYKCIMAVHKK
jgi:glycosyltransferase involved in cell wall biosynthesis